MRISFDIYSILGFFAFVLMQGITIAYSTHPIGAVLWFAAEACKFMLIIYIAATVKIKPKGDD